MHLRVRMWSWKSKQELSWPLFSPRHSDQAVGFRYELEKVVRQAPDLGTRYLLSPLEPSSSVASLTYRGGDALLYGLLQLVAHVREPLGGLTLLNGGHALAVPEHVDLVPFREG